MEIIDMITDLIGENKWLNVVLAFIAFMSAVAAVVPTPKKGTMAYKLYTVLVDLPALNVGKAKQTGEEPIDKSEGDSLG
jgi:hypothetical protein